MSHWADSPDDIYLSTSAARRFLGAPSNEWFRVNAPKPSGSTHGVGHPANLYRLSDLLAFKMAVVAWRSPIPAYEAIE